MAALPWQSRKKVGLALGGGVARSLAHIGVFKVFKRENIPVDFIAATSGGALIGALFAFGLDPLYIECEVMNRKTFSFFNLSFRSVSPFSYNIVQQICDTEIGKRSLKGANIPIAVVAFDLRSGKKVVLENEEVGLAVSASAAFPAAFKPIKLGNYLLVDGGALDNLPVDVLSEKGMDVKIAVDVLPNKPLTKDPTNTIQVFGRVVDIMIKKASSELKKQADVVIEPDFAPDLWIADFHKAHEIISAGEKAAMDQINKIRSLL